jgi:hypothetical protein
MTDRLQIEITGDLPDAGKFAILASAEDHAKEFAASLAAKHPGVTLSVSVKAIRPGKKTAAPPNGATQKPGSEFFGKGPDGAG